MTEQESDRVQQLIVRLQDVASRHKKALDLAIKEFKIGDGVQSLAREVINSLKIEADERGREGSPLRDVSYELESIFRFYSIQQRQVEAVELTVELLIRQLKEARSELMELHIT